MKEFFSSFFCVLLLLATTGCTGASKNSEVQIYDYKNIKIDRDFLEITEEDIKSIILLDFSAQEFFEEVIDRNIVENDDIVLIDVLDRDQNFIEENLYYYMGNEDAFGEIDQHILDRSIKDSVACDTIIDGIETRITINIKGIYRLYDVNNEDALKSFYACETLTDTIEYIKNRAKNEIIYNYMWEIILENSCVNSFPKAILDLMDGSKEHAEYDNTFIEEEDYDTYSYYYELTIALGILENENIIVNDEKINNKIEQLAIQNDVSTESVKLYFNDNDIYYITVMDEVRNVLISYAKIVD